MSKVTSKAGAAEDTAAPEDTKPAAAEDTAAEPDPRDVELARLRAELEAAKNPPAPAHDEPADPRDRTIAALRAELEQIRSTPEGANAEMVKAFLALEARVTAMANGTGLVPLPENGENDPFLYGAVLECGDVFNAQHPHGTHHHCPEHGTVPVRSHWKLSAEMAAAANAK